MVVPVLFPLLGLLVAISSAPAEEHAHVCSSDKVLRNTPDILVAQPHPTQTDEGRRAQIEVATTFDWIIRADDTYLLADDRMCTAVNQTVAIGDPSPDAGACGDDDSDCFYSCSEADLVGEDLLIAIRESFDVAIGRITEYAKLTSSVPSSGVTLSAVPSCESSSVTPSVSYTDGAGVGVGLVIFLTARPTTSSAIAFGVPCQSDSDTNRPIMGQVNFSAAVKNSPFISNLATIAVHELLHVLGFTESKFPDFTPPDGSNFIGTNGAIEATSILNLVDSHFGCPQTSVTLLDSDFGEIQGSSHWDGRLLFSELMTASPDLNTYKPRVSTFTLALLEASGWYAPDYTKADDFTFGEGAGCDFVNKVCGEEWRDQGYIGSPTGDGGECPTELGCNWDRLFTAFALRQSSGNAGECVGTSDVLNQCPIFQPYESCVDGENVWASNNAFGTERGNVSRCYMSTLAAKNFDQTAKPGCYPSNCYLKVDPTGAGSTFLQVNIGGDWVDCPPAGGMITTNSFEGFLTCPEVSAVCSGLPLGEVHATSGNEKLVEDWVWGLVGVMFLGIIVAGVFTCVRKKRTAYSEEDHYWDPQDNIGPGQQQAHTDAVPPMYVAERAPVVVEQVGSDQPVVALSDRNAELDMEPHPDPYPSPRGPQTTGQTEGERDEA